MDAIRLRQEYPPRAHNEEGELILASLLLLQLAAGETARTAHGVSDGRTVTACGAFEFRVPAGTEARSGVAIDSCAKSFDGPGFSLAYDYGVYSGELKNAERDPHFHSARIVVHGKPATVVSGPGAGVCPGSQMIMGIDIDNFAPNGLLRPPNALAMWGCVQRPESVQTLGAIFQSIRHIY
jgi:hypothetical protein